MPGDVHGRDLLVEHLRPSPSELVDRVVDAELIAGDGLRRDHDGVARLDRDGLVVAVCDARERRHRLTLAPGAQHEQALGRKLRGFVRIDDRVFGERDVPEVARDVDVLAHRAADDDDLPPALHGHVGGLLHTVDVRGERGDEDLPLPQREDRAERLTHEALRAGVAGTLGVRRVAEQEIDAPVADLRELADVGLQPVDGRVIELPVPCVHDATRRRLDDERRRVGNRVRDADELHPERAEFERLVARRRGDQLRLLREAVLVELRLHERKRQRSRDDRLHVDLT